MWPARRRGRGMELMTSNVLRFVLIHVHSLMTDADRQLDAQIVDYFSRLVFPNRPIAIASKHSRLINNNISTFLINRNIDGIVKVRSRTREHTRIHAHRCSWMALVR
jgi:hypothetical protein